jgi:glycosyltransferase involved in cell wall biosynthesis
MRISFALLCHKETSSLYELLKTLVESKPYDFEVVVVHDNVGDTSETIRVLSEFDGKIMITSRPLNNDYAAQKNYMTERCSGDWIINPDADELLPNYILENIHLIIKESDTECIWLPRINIVEGMTPELAPQFGFQLNEQGWINFPDPQQRIYKNDYPRIHWEKPVHERVVGYKTHSILPFDMETIEHLAIRHVKDLDTQIRQNQKYAKIMNK